MSQIDFHHNFNRFFDGLEIKRMDSNRNEQLLLPSHIGEGTIRRFIPRTDIEVIVSNYTMNRERAISLQTEVAMVELQYCLQGTREVSIAGERNEIIPGICSLQLIKQADARFEFTGNTTYHMVSIGIPIHTFHHFMEEGDGTRRVDFSQLLGSQDYGCEYERITPDATLRLHQLLEASLMSSTRNIELECRAMELLEEAFQLFFSNPRTSHTKKMSRTDMQKVKQAREIMVQQMSDPPSLLELSRMVGLNDFKLKKSFKEMYGATVFGYLREKRLERALFLLQQGKLNVTEAAYEVGYSNASYFSEAFRRKYGVNPGSLVRQSERI
ncbi:AraC family transcriptional regulator [Paenibacillaceae sp. P-4]|uniref:helix-turn-helix transcriptional regulator n=1 Tax=Paenibacillaceae bacterium P-4 TaxID=3160969 RepID=UPI0032E83B59